MKMAAIMFAGILMQAVSIEAFEMPKTLVELTGGHPKAARLSDSVLVVIDAQREYVDGKLPLVGIEPSIAEVAKLLGRARKAGTPVIHVVHRGRGGLFDPATPYYAIIPQLRPASSETVVEKALPNAFAGTNLAEAIAKTGKKNLILVGYMTHMCISTTARAALDHGYQSTIVANATATRDLPDGKGGAIPAATIQAANLAALSDRFAVIVQEQADIHE